MNVKLIAVGSRPWELWLKHWGVSFLINEDILFDTFANYRVLSKKAKCFNVDLEKIKTVIISHDHWDHIGGLWNLLERRKGLRVYLPAHASEETKARIRSLGGHVVDSVGAKIVDTGIHVTDELTGHFDGKEILEQAAVLETKQGLVIIVGCSHPGITTIIKRAKELFKTPVYGVIGGLHLMSSSTNAIRMCAQDVKNEGVRLVAPTHCTGWKAEGVFKDVFREGFVSLCEGHLLSF